MSPYCLNIQAWLSKVLQQIKQMNDRLDEIKDEVSKEFPLDGDQAKELKASIRDQVMVIHDIEFNAVKELEKAIDWLPAIIRLPIMF